MKLEDYPQSASIGWLREQTKSTDVIGTCSACKHWDNSHHRHHMGYFDPPQGDCRFDGENDGASTETPVTFGCINWGEKK